MDAFLLIMCLLPNATLLNDKYPPSKNPQQWQIILIENNAVVGGGATIVPGCSIGHSSVLAQVQH